MDYFGTLMMYLFRLTFKPSRIFLKKIVSEYVYVVNIKPTVMTLPFGVNIDIHDAVRYKDMMEYGLGPNKEILTFGFRKSEPVRIM